MRFGRTLKIEKCRNLVSVYKTFKNLLLQNGVLLQMVHHLHYFQNNSQRQFEHRKFDPNL